MEVPQQQIQQPTPPPYTVPGVLHFLQVEWRRFERERNEWEIERSDLKSRISFLEGEKRGLDNIKADLTQRVKMLEFALRQEREKIRTLQAASDGGAPSAPDLFPEALKESAQILDSNQIPGSVVGETTSGIISGFSKGIGQIRSREILKNYLREANYLLAHSGLQVLPSGTPLPLPTHAFTDETAAAVVPETSPVSSAASLSSGKKPSQQTTEITTAGIAEKPPNGVSSLSPKSDSLDYSSATQVPSSFFPKTDKNELKGAGTVRKVGASVVGDQLRQEVFTDETSPDDSVVPRKSLSSYVSDNDDQVMWRPKATLRSHLDSVRSVSFLPTTDLALLSGSEDGTAKLWNLKSLISSKKTPSDLEPSYTFRGHNGPVLCLSVSHDGQTLYTGSSDATLIAWRVPSITRETYSSADMKTQRQTFVAHTNSVWDVKPNPAPRLPLLASASADGTVKLWDIRGDVDSSPLRITLCDTTPTKSTSSSPTAIDWMKTDPRRLAAAYQNSLIVLFDVETGVPVIRLKSDETFDGVSSQINSIICHPTLPLIISAHEDRHIRFFDINSGTCTHSMTGHLDSVSSLDILASETTLVTAGHDCSVRWWDIGSKSCIQEHSTHRRKYDEGIWSIRAHRTHGNVIATAGADGTCKVFMHADAKRL